LSSSACSVFGNVGMVPVRLFEPSNNCVRPLNDDRVLGIESVSDVDVRSRVCRELASDEDAASVARGDGDNVWKLTNRLCSPVRLVRLLGSVEPICALRTSASVERRMRPGEAKSESGSAVMEVASRRRVVKDVKLVNELGRGPAGIELPPMTSRDCTVVKPPISLGNVAGTPGYVSCNDETCPKVLQLTPDQVQKSTF